MSLLDDVLGTNRNVTLGKPVFKGMRVPVEFILKKAQEGMTVRQIFDAYPLVAEQLLEALSTALQRDPEFQRNMRGLQRDAHTRMVNELRRAFHHAIREILDGRLGRKDVQ